MFSYFSKLNGGIVLLVFGTIIFIIGLICFVLIICVSERVDGDAGDDRASDDTDGTPVSSRVVVVVCAAFSQQGKSMLGPFVFTFILLYVVKTVK